MNCKICNRETDVIFKISHVDYPICKKCSTAIFIQQARAYASNETIFEQEQKREGRKVSRHPKIVAEVLNYLYTTLLKSGRPEYEVGKLPIGYVEKISARVNEGHTREELMAVAFFKWKEWGRDDKMRKFLRVDTLYGRDNFKRYLAEIEHKLPEWKIGSNKEQKAIIKKLNSLGLRGEINEETDKLAKKLIKTGYDNKQFLNLYLLEKI